MAPITKVKLRVTGRVQGVFYRQTARDKARSLGLSGRVRNADDGSVELEAHGPRDRVEELMAWCRQGPPAAHVSNVIVEWRDDGDGTFEEKPRFDITY